jgi:chromosome segregation ATPase
MAEDKSSKASKEDLKSVQAIRAEKERIVALNKQLADLQKALSQFSNDELQSNRQAIALSERIGSLYEEREKTIQNIRTNREQLRNLDRDELTNSSLRERYTQRQLDASERLLQTQTERRRLSSDELDKIDSITDRYDDLVDYSSKLLQNVKLRRDQEESIEGILNIAQGLSKAAADAIREGGENAEGFARAAQVGVEAKRLHSKVNMRR